jgi:FkbM family methyltransferase
MTSPPRVIFDLGANAGMNLDYFLSRADLVVAIEANPDLVAGMERAFAASIARGQLIVVNAAITIEDREGTTSFYVHRTNSVLSQLPEPSEASRADFEEIQVECVSVSRLMAEFGTPFYMKIDLESFDAQVLREMFRLGIRPAYVSAEAHSSEILETLVREGGYSAFTLVHGPTVHLRYRWHRVQSHEGRRRVRFPPHSSGPFGNDLRGPWYSVEGIEEVLALEGYGWKDLHATDEAPRALRRRPNRIAWVGRRLTRSGIAVLGSWRARARQGWRTS